MAIEVTFTDDPVRVLNEAKVFLASQPILNNLILTLLNERIARREPGRYWMATNGQRTIGLIFQSPLDREATLTPMDLDVVSSMVDVIAEMRVRLPGVNGEADTAARFAGQWAERTKSAAIPWQGQRIYEVLALQGKPVASGHLRKAEPQDRDLLIRWTGSFQTETREHGADPQVLVDAWLPSGQLWLWDDGEPTSMAVNVEPTEGVVRLKNVYTPPEKRNRGFAGACVHALSKRILSRGHRCMLYTDLGNPTSNTIYRRMGYTAVAEALRYRFQS